MVAPVCSPIAIGAPRRHQRCARVGAAEVLSGADAATLEWLQPFAFRTAPRPFYDLNIIVGSAAFIQRGADQYAGMVTAIPGQVRTPAGLGSQFGLGGHAAASGGANTVSS